MESGVKGSRWHCRRLPLTSRSGITHPVDHRWQPWSRQCPQGKHGCWVTGPSTLVVCSGPKVPCGLLLRTRVTSGAPGCALLGLPGPADSQLLSLPLARGGGSENVPWATILEFLSQPSPLLTSEPAWCFSGSLHVDLEKHRMRIQSINLTLGLEGPFSSSPPGPGSPA